MRRVNSQTARFVWFLLVCASLLCARAALALDPTSRISQYGHTVWRVQDGYFGSQPYAITQTTDGYIWIGTRDGLFQFDGVQFVRWSSPFGEQLPSSFVVSLLGARDGSLWIGTHNGLAHLVDNHLTVYPKVEGSTIVDILEGRDGRIWIDRHGFDDQTHPLCQILGTDVRCYGKADGVDSFSSGPLLEDTAGNLWVGSSTTLVRWRMGSSKVYRPKALMSNAGQAGIVDLAAAPDGTLWVGMDSGRGAGLESIVGGVLKPFVSPKLNGEKLDVWSLAVDQQKNLWVGTTTQGIYRIRGTDVDHYGSADGLSGDLISRIFADREGNLWMLTSQGIDMFRDLRVKTISTREGLGEDEVESLTASRNGTVWIGTKRLDALGPDGISAGPGKALHGNMVTCLFEDHAGRLWVGMDNALSVYDRGKFRPITKPDGGPVGMVTGITEDLENNIWIESIGPSGTLMRIRDLKVQQEWLAPAMPLARKIVADPRSGVWLGLVDGNLARYRSGQLTTFVFHDHPNSLVQAMTAAPDGSILGATAFGVVAWKDGTQQILTTRNGLPCNGVNALISDDEGNLWLYAECGLVEIPKDEMALWWEHPKSRLKLRVFDALDGVRPGFGNFTNSAKTPDGRLWFANGSVVQVVDPARMTENRVVPPVVVSAVLADRKSIPLEEPIRLPALTRDLEIDYAALSYALPKRVLFRYMLEGHDADWKEPGTRRQAFYNDLRPGTYRFHVIACNQDGVWNETGAFLEFSIAPAFYQTNWFLALCLAACLAMLWGLYQLRLRQMAVRLNMRLEERLNERTRIARELHDTLLQSFQGLLPRLQAASNLLPTRPDNAKEKLDAAIDQASEAIAEGRDAVLDLRSSTVVSNDLAVAIKTLGEELGASGDNHKSPVFDVAVEGAPRDLRPTVRDELYRIAAEALRNAFRHAQANRIEAELHYDERQLRLRIRDNGVGIEPHVIGREGRPGHFGLHGMRERAKMIGANLELWSNVSSGTEVELTIPASHAYETRGPQRSLGLDTKEP